MDAEGKISAHELLVDLESAPFGVRRHRQKWPSSRRGAEVFDARRKGVAVRLQSDPPGFRHPAVVQNEVPGWKMGETPSEGAGKMGDDLEVATQD